VFISLKKEATEKSVYPRYSFIMNKDQFLQELSRSGYPEPIEVTQPSGGHLDNHTHPFAVRALVVDGCIEIESQGGLKKYEAGDMFELAYEQPHSETYGPTGVKYLASRKQ
jgi:hypothetical protein